GVPGLFESDGKLSPRGIDYYVARAKGGTGLIVTCSTYVTREFDQPFQKHVIDGDRCIARLNELAEAVHDYQTKVAIQLSAGHGRVLRASLLSECGAVAPSAMPCYFDPSVTARELTTAEVERLVRAFEVAARVSKDAGIDAIQLHAHEGYLFDQFQTALWNRRTDKYGGDLRGRLQFAMEVIEAVRKGAGADFPIIYRFGLTHYLEGGREIEEGLEIARQIEAAGVAALEIDAGCYETWYWPHPTTYQQPGCMVDLAEMVKRVVKIPVIAVGKLGYPDLAERVLQEGKADFISLGRALLADPEWPNKVKEGRLGDIRPCLADGDGCHGRIRQGKYLSCTVNPATGMEREMAITTAERKKSVLVIGGGPAGMEAAIVAKSREHKVTLWEKSNVLGGNLIPASIPDFKQDYHRLIGYLSTQMKKLGVIVELDKEATAELVQQLKPDAVFLATGSRPLIPDIPGIEMDKVVTASDLLLGKKEAGESVVVVGGGLVGCETAVYLAQKGKKVTVVEILGSVAGDMGTRDRMYLLKLLSEAKVKILTKTMISEITDKGITVTDECGDRSTLKADTVVLAVGLKSNNHLLKALMDKVPAVYAIGDCVEPRKVINAIWEGYRIARLV
ncbi:FAD-dependent oxidoreductase, partial [Chloroflexota bacterium]